MSPAKNKKVIKMKKRSFGAFGFFLIFLAVLIILLFIQSFTREHVSIYEVTQTQLADNENLRGIVLREESLVNAKKNGYVNYYVGEGSKLSKTTTVYSTSDSKDTTTAIANTDTDDVALSDEDTRNIRNTISDFRENFDLSEYGSIRNFRYNVDNVLLELSDVSLTKSLQKLKQESGSDKNFSLVKAEKTGIISFSSDGRESLSKDTIQKSDFTLMNDAMKQIRTTEQITAGSPVYRVVTSEKWSIVVSLTKEQYIKIAKKDSVSVKIKKDNITMTPVVQEFTSNGSYYANLVFDKYMIRYLNNRYLDVEIIFNNATGLKIPVSSVLKKKCYVIPKEYITKGANSNQTGVATITYTDSGAPKINFVAAEVYYYDEKGNAYIDAAVLKAGTTITKGNSTSSGRFMQVTKIKKLEGVYNCNQGYCRFEYIKKLYANKEYAIVEIGNQYSLSNFDHIILNPDMITESDVIY